MADRRCETAMWTLEQSRRDQPFWMKVIDAVLGFVRALRGFHG
jgi:hypothetical protein